MHWKSFNFIKNEAFFSKRATERLGMTAKIKIIFSLVIVSLLEAACDMKTSRTQGPVFIQQMQSKIWTYSKTERPFSPSGTVVLVGGCFDVFHFGHLLFLQEAKKEGDHLIVALESDETITNYKKRSPIHHAQQRAEILASLSFVDEIIILPPLKGYEDYFKLVQFIRPNIIAVTEGDPQFKNKRKQMQSIGGKAKIVTPLIKDLSTTKIISSGFASDFKN